MIIKIVSCSIKSKIIIMKKLLFYTFIVSSLLACKTETKSTFDLATAKKEIESANKAISLSMSKGDSLGVAAAYSSDGALMLSNMPAVKGKDNLIKTWGSFMSVGLGNIELTTLEVWGDENYITEEGQFTTTSKEGVQLDKGKYIVVWKKEDGKWKLHRDLSNSDLPIATK